jgi:hypothetical protein
MMTAELMLIVARGRVAAMAAVHPPISITSSVASNTGAIQS